MRRSSKCLIAVMLSSVGSLAWSSCPSLSDVEAKAGEFLNKGAENPDELDKALSYVASAFKSCKKNLSNELRDALDSLEMSVTVQQSLPDLNRKLKEKTDAYTGAKQPSDIEPALLEELVCLQQDFKKINKDIDADLLKEPQKKNWHELETGLAGAIDAAKKKFSSMIYKEGEEKGKEDGFKEGVKNVQTTIKKLVDDYVQNRDEKLNTLGGDFEKEYDAQNSNERPRRRVPSDELEKARHIGRSSFEVILISFLNNQVLTAAIASEADQKQGSQGSQQSSQK